MNGSYTSPNATATPATPMAPAADPRETMRVLPDWLQPLLTEWTGKALPGETPWFAWTPATRTAATLFTFTASIAASMTAVWLGGAALALLPISWLLTVSSVRAIQTAVVHHASHGKLFAHPAWSRFIAELASLLAWVAPLSVYERDHNKHHGDLAGETDPDLQFIASLGMKPGRTVREYWRLFWFTMVSPVFHARYFSARIRANFVEATPGRRLASWIFAAFLLGSIGVTGAWSTALLGYLLPITVLTHMAAWAGFLGLHHWVPLPLPGGTKRDSLSSLTYARFVGEAVPVRTESPIRNTVAWIGWGARLLTVHSFQRMAIVTNDLPSHDWHHDRPSTWDWPNYAYARRDYLAADPRRAAKARENWGAGAAIEETFRRLAALPPDAQLGQTKTYIDIAAIYNSMLVS